MIEEDAYFHAITSSSSPSIFITPHHLLIKYIWPNVHHMSRGVMYGQVLEKECRDLASHERAQGTGCLGEGFWPFDVFFVAWWERYGVEVCGYLGSRVTG